MGWGGTFVLIVCLYIACSIYTSKATIKAFTELFFQYSLFVCVSFTYQYYCSIGLSVINLYQSSVWIHFSHTCLKALIDRVDNVFVLSSMIDCKVIGMLTFYESLCNPILLLQFEYVFVLLLTWARRRIVIIVGVCVCVCVSVTS